MSSFKRAGSLDRITLIPSEGDEDEKFPLQAHALDKLDFNEILTFSTNDKTQLVLDCEDTSDDSWCCCIHRRTLSTLRTSHLPKTLESHKWRYVRVLAIPGEPPYASCRYDKLEFENLEFEIPSYSSIANPRFAYEDLCRVAEEVKKLAAIKSTSFVTDVETLSAIFHTVRDKLVYTEDDKGIEGMCFNIHSENGVIFMKTLNSSRLQGLYHHAASSHLMTKMVQQPFLIGNKLRENMELTQFKRVVSYRFGDYPLIVEDPNHVTRNVPRREWMHRMQLKESGFLAEPDQLEDDRDQNNACCQEDIGPDLPPYVVFKNITMQYDRCSPLTSSQDTALFPRIAYKREDDITRSQLWFSGTRDFLVGLLPNPDLRDDLVDTGSFDPGLGTRAGWPEFDKWLSDHQVELSMKLVHRILAYIKHTANNLSQRGIKKFHLKHMRKSDQYFIVSLGEEHGHLPEDLVSSHVATELGKAEENVKEKKTD
ncbi:uncharacterized protein F4807DRAFT_433406 [Annulohypoxylon truncatum]|uniref:uncharacterized protein n=1 Tax=Annulohypoxylon truncatum TaxID=327061 RepID=UPI002008B848|nr:uncharacterized protein F4807DRAFT_433406 [Annulohypoxylon truncatum]KAI1207810.1 hypothetical protein F4807DRAFT_433406 [Annulohypoxylon truncatum]